MVACHEAWKQKTVASRKAVYTLNRGRRGYKQLIVLPPWSLILQLRSCNFDALGTCVCGRCAYSYSFPYDFEVDVGNLLSLLWIERVSPSVGGLHHVEKRGSRWISSSFSPAVILGSSMVRNVTVPGAKTIPYPGAWVKNITKLLPNILCQDMDIDSIVVHVDFNDIMNGSSEHLKLDFKELIDSLLDTNIRPIISGPVTSLNRGIERFSRILSLHNWLR